LSDTFGHCTLVPGFPKGQDIGILTQAPWSPAIPQESRLGDAFEDRVPPTGSWSECRILGLKLVNAVAECSCRGKDDVKWSRRSHWTWREPQNVETTVLGIDGNNTEVVSGRCDGCVDNGMMWDHLSTHRISRRPHRTRDTGSDREPFMEVAVVSVQGCVVPIVCAQRRQW
jgi:hypothetical protein